MDDLSGLNWASTSANPRNPTTTANASGAFHQILRPTPSPLGSGRNTPVSVQSSGGIGSKPPHQGQKPAQDHFSNLVNFGTTTKSTANLSLREQQQRLEADRRRKEQEKKNQLCAHYGNGQFWDSLSQRASANNSRSVSPDVQGIGSLAAARKREDDDEDLFAAFKAETKVDKSSYYPPPPPSSSGPPSGKATPSLDLGNPSAWTQPALSGAGRFNDDDDPFDLRSMKPTAQAPTSQPAPTVDDDDVLGDLGKPVEEVKKMQATQQRSPQPQPGKPIEDDSSDSSDDEDTNVDNLDPLEKAVSQLVDLGFTPENARRGITQSGAGLNVQAVAGWLLDDAERQAREKAKGRPAQNSGGSRQEGRSQGGGGVAWMQDDEADLSKTAAAVGATFLKGANSLWKTGQKKMQQAVADFQQDTADLNQPKWMRSAQQSARPMMTPKKSSHEVTDEALMLESGARPGRRPGRKPGGNAVPDPPSRPALHGTPSSREQSPFASAPAQRSSPVPEWKKGSQTLGPRLDAKARLSKLAQDDDRAPAYISPARRGKKVSYPQQQPDQLPNPPPPSKREFEPEPEPEPDLLNTAAPPALRPKPAPRQLAQPSPARSTSQPKKSRTNTPEPAIPPRQIPPISPTALQNSLKHRADGAAHFKRGDYAAAHACYSNSLSRVPHTHPLAILILTNRSLTALKIGEPRQAIDDASNALRIIGPSGGVDETITVKNGEKKDMRELYGKALSHKAEALEQLEKWSEAASVWQQCVENGLGGATATAGKQRCQKALAPKPAAAPRPKPMVAKPRSKPRSAMDDLIPAKESAAVERLREANKAAEAAEDEKFALADKVDARISAWRDGRRDNLRALLGGLDKVLWEGSGWRTVGMHELVMVKRVKIVYMKAIAKCHPDKVGFFLFFFFFFSSLYVLPFVVFSLLICPHQPRRRFSFLLHYTSRRRNTDIVLILAAPECQRRGQAHCRDSFCYAE